MVDVMKSIANTVVISVLAALAGIVTQGFDLFSADWVAIGKLVTNTAFIAFFTSLTDRFLSDEDNRLFGSIG